MTPHPPAGRSRQLTLALLVVALALAVVAILDGGSTISIAPDRLVFTGLNGQSRDLFMQTLGGAPVALTDDDFLDGEAAFSPDGRSLAFVSDRAGSLDIWVMNADGTAPRQLTTDPGDDVGPSWAPDGKRISFVSDREGDRTNIFVVDLETGAVSQITFQARGLAFLDWSPDGDRIAYSAVGPDDPSDPQLTPLHLVVIPATGGEPAVLRDGAGWNWGAAWSPDGESIAFSWTPPGVASTETSWLQIVSADGTNPRRLRQGSWGDYAPAWSPDGRRIAFTSTQAGFPQIYIWDLETDELTLALGGTLAFDATWAPN